MIAYPLRVPSSSPISGGQLVWRRLCMQERNVKNCLQLGPFHCTRRHAASISSVSFCIRIPQLFFSFFVSNSHNDAPNRHPVTLSNYSLFTLYTFALRILLQLANLQPINLQRSSLILGWRPSMRRIVPRAY